MNDASAGVRALGLAMALATAGVSLACYFGALPSSHFPLYLSSPSLATREDMETNLVWQTAFTLGRCTVAFAFAALAYIGLAAIFSWRMPASVRAAAAVAQSIPPLVFAPLLLLAFGANEPTLLLAAAAFTFFGLLISTPDRDVTRTTRAAFSRLARQSSAYRWWRLYLPETLSSMRDAFSMLWLVLVGVVVVLEYMGGTQGFGRAMSVLVSYAEISSVAWASVGLAACAGIVSSALRGAAQASSSAAENLGG